MAATLSSVHAVVLEHRERNKKSSRADIERFIQESELKLASLESQISALIELRDRERTCVATLKDLIAPIHTLPVELLPEIFEVAIRAESHVEDALQISQVCSGWRQVSHSTPRLWTGKMWINLREDTHGDREQVYVDELKAWLLRSVPLTIPITLVLDSESINNRILDEVMRTAPRWRSLTLKMESEAPAPSFVSRLAESKLNNLEELGLLRFDKDVDRAALLSFTTAPRLRKLEILSNFLPMSMPWSRLTGLTFTSSTLTVLDILAQCPNLIQAVVRAAGWNVLPQARRDILTLSHLRTLDLRFRDGQHFVPLSDCLSAPALEELYLDFWNRETDRLFWTSAHFTAFQLRAANITQLGFEDSLLTVDDLKIAIHHAPSLTHLTLDNCGACFDDAFANALCYKPDTTPLAPNLHHFVLFRFDFGDNFTEDTLARMIVSRWWTDTELASRLVPPAVARWTHVELNGNRYLGEELADMLKDLPSDVLILL
ncbi:F-box domain-containing protein [Mycena sanguinolenta]|uniref:F-box domain-containing protein n=1 Tax=Mycena sanguinolenta TaxID=230812 RepID=A0A8H6YMP5_9AGAR|nr:F-box domain-containing protein [Mycena sanguinolenta]